MSRQPTSRPTKKSSTPKAPRNLVAKALSERRASGAAGKHVRSTGAQRRADKVDLQKAMRKNT